MLRKVYYLCAGERQENWVTMETKRVLSNGSNASKFSGKNKLSVY